MRLDDFWVKCPTKQEAAPFRGRDRQHRQADKVLAEGSPITEMARSLEVPKNTPHRWRAEYWAPGRDAVKRLKHLKKENVLVKCMVADRLLNI
jgi:hypothetical protein